MAYQNRDLIINHLREALAGAIAEADGDETLSSHLRTRTKLRFISMSDEELQELAKFVSRPPERPFEMVYQKLKGEVEELRQTAAEWTKDSQQHSVLSLEKDVIDRILIVEDKPALREELVLAFKQAGFAVSEASNYSQALQKLQESKIKLVVMESLLPDKDGFEASYEFRSRFGIPVILLGEDSSDHAWEKAMKAEVDHYELKPYRYLPLVARAKIILWRYK